MPTLDWIGKSKVISHHQEVPFRVLENQYTYGANDSENMIIHGDNLEALKALLPWYGGKVKCIYIDPPYNTGNEGWVYNDNVNDPKIRKWLGEVVGREGEYIWYTETKTAYVPGAGDGGYYLGRHGDTGYYFYYEPDQLTILNHAFLPSISEKAGGYVVYADRCALSNTELAEYGIIFKKIPRDITKI